MKKFVLQNQIWLILIIAILVMTGCSNNEPVEECLTGQTFRFWGGLWHGFISPFHLIAMLIRDDITIYAPNNSGVGYAIGFLIGSGGWGFLGGKGAKRKNKNRDDF